MFPSDTHFDAKVTLETEMSPVPEDLPFHILLLGDWSGRESCVVDSDLAKSNPIEVDRDNFDEILQRLNVGLSLDFRNSNESIVSLTFTELEDFHPDKIFQRLPLFADLRDIRRRLVNSETFQSAAREVRSWLIETETEKASETRNQDVAVEEIKSPREGLLDQILERTDEVIVTTHSQTTASSELSALVKNLVKPHLIQTDTAEQSKLLIIVDEVISDLMRRILHHPQFQALESAWRGVYFLVKKLETDNELRIYLLDVTKAELSANLKSASNLADSKLYQILSKQLGASFDDKSWAIVCGNYSFSVNVDDISTLIRLAKVAAETNTPFISHIRPDILGFESFAEIDPSESWKVFENSDEEKLWNMLRSIPEATHLALALPRTLARLPYGEKTEPTETFAFEEFTAVAQHEQYLWNNPIFVNALLLAQTFRQYGWNILRNFSKNVDGFPVHLYQEGFENQTKPCAETLMTQNNYETILEQGLIPLISLKNSDRVQVASLQSIAYPSSLLKGRWN